MVTAYDIGVDLNYFWQLTPKTFLLMCEKYKNKEKEKTKIIDYNNWCLAQYFQISIGSCFSKEIKFPDKPLFSDFDNNDEEEKCLSEEQLELERKRTYMFFSNLGKHIDIKK